MREMIRYATLAANGHNTQPWKFGVGADAIDIYPDAARAAGYAPEVTYPDAGDVIRVRLAADVPQSSPLFHAIPLRQNTRSDYDGQPIETALLEQLVALPQEPGVILHFVTQAAEGDGACGGIRPAGQPEPVRRQGVSGRVDRLAALHQG